MSENEFIPIVSGEPETAPAGGVDASLADTETPEEIRASTNESEETPVIDVHAPHGGLHTWKDFWIHLGTITLGLLIAISLEQSVEWLHRMHERSQLEDDLRVEAENNHGYVGFDVAIYDKQIDWPAGAAARGRRGADERREGGDGVSCATGWHSGFAAVCGVSRA
jgi:hypothetical protein